MTQCESLTATAELALVGGIITRGLTELARIRGTLASAEFADARARAVLEAASACMDSADDVGPVQIAARLELAGAMTLVGGLDGLDKLGRRARAEEERDVLIARVRDHAKVRRAAGQAAKLAALGQRPEALADPGRYFAAIAALAEEQRAQIPRGTVSAHEAATMTFRAFNDRGKRVCAVPTPIHDLSELLGGGYVPGRSYAVAGRPSSGKSALALQSAIHGARRGHPQYFFSREMPVVDLVGRAIVQLAGLDGKRWAKGPSAFTRDEGLRIIRALETFSKLPITIDVETADVTAQLARLRVWLETDVRRLQEENPDALPMAWEDYLQLCTLAGKFDSRQHQVSTMSGMLCTFGRAHGCAMGIVCQLNRLSKKENRPPRADDLRESGAIEQDVNAVILVHREIGAGEINDEREVGQVVEQDGWILLDKNRDGSPGVVRSTWHGPSTRWTSRVTPMGGVYAEH